MTRIIWALLVCVALGVQALKAQDAPTATGQNEPTLSGNTLKLEDIVTKADVVFVGEIMQIGFPNPSSPGMASYGVQVKVLQVLRGSVEGQAIVTVATRAINREEPPKAGSQYIFFAKKEGDRFEAFKLLPATDNHITKIRALFVAAPAGK